MSFTWKNPRLRRMLQPAAGIFRCALGCLALALGGAACSPSGAQATAEPVPASATAARAQARGKIDVEGGLLQLSAGAEGIVSQLPVQEGQRVQAGQLLLRLGDAAVQAEAQVADAQWRLAQARLDARTARLPALQQRLQRWQAAAGQGAADGQQVQEAAQALRDAQSEQAIARAEVQVARQQRAQSSALQSRLALRAPEAGTVVRVHSHVGAHAVPGAPAVVLLPERPLIVRAELNEAYAMAVREGMPAKVVIDGDAGAARSLPDARVLRISPVYGAGRLQEDSQRGPVRVIECVLAFDQPPTARVGQNVRVLFHE